MAEWLISESVERRLADGRVMAVATRADGAGKTEAEILLDGVRIVFLTQGRDGERGLVDAELGGPLAAHADNSLRLQTDGQVWWGSAFGQAISPSSLEALTSQTSEVEPRMQRVLAELPVDDVIGELGDLLDARQAERANWGCWGCTAKCSAIGAGCVAACAAFTGPVAHICSAACLAKGLSCQEKCGC